LNNQTKQIDKITKIQEIDHIYNEFKKIIKKDEQYFYKYSEIFFSLKELENINIINLIKEKEFNKENRLFRNENWRKVTI